MSVDITTAVVIARPREAVAGFMFDPKNDAIWTTGVVDSRPAQPGLLVTGAKVERISRFLGRTFGYLVTVVDHGDARFVQMKVTEPFPMEIRYELADCPEGTRASIRASGEATGFFKLAAPLLNKMVKRNITKDLERLRDHLESRPVERAAASVAHRG